MESRLLKQIAADDIPTDPPDADAFLDWAKSHPKGKASLENHRTAYVRRLHYYGIPVPAYLATAWDSAKAVDKATRSGRMKARNLFFRHLPSDLNRLLKAKPWGDARDEMFRHAIVLGLVAGPRAAEPALLRVRDVRPDKLCIENWLQSKKGYGRTVSVPEAWFFNGPGLSVRNYLENVRPKLLKGHDCEAYFVSLKGRAYSADAWRNLMTEGMTKTLGYPIGPHALRRAFATLRRVYGWSVDEIAVALDDKPNVVEKSYIGSQFVNAAGMKPRPRSGGLPMLPPYWRIEQSLGLGKSDPQEGLSP